MKNLLSWIGKIGFLLVIICLLSLWYKDVEETNLEKINQDIARLTAVTPKAHYQKTMSELLRQRRIAKDNLELIKNGLPRRFLNPIKKLSVTTLVR